MRINQLVNHYSVMKTHLFRIAATLLISSTPVCAKTVYLTCDPWPDSDGGFYQQGYVIDLDKKTVFSAWRRYGSDHQRPHEWKGANKSVETFSDQEIHFFQPAWYDPVGGSYPRQDFRLNRSTLQVTGPYEPYKNVDCQLVDKPFMETTPKF